MQKRIWDVEEGGLRRTQHPSTPRVTGVLGGRMGSRINDHSYSFLIIQLLNQCVLSTVIYS